MRLWLANSWFSSVSRAVSDDARKPPLEMINCSVRTLKWSHCRRATVPKEHAVTSDQSDRPGRSPPTGYCLLQGLGMITDDTMRQANKMVDLQGHSIPEAAAFVQTGQIQSEMRVR